MAAVAAAAMIALPQAPGGTGGGDLVALVDPLIGTGGEGHTFPGATVPFGMVQFSPVSIRGGPGGYRFTNSVLKGFSLTRLSGSGCTNYGDVPLLPTTRRVIVAPPQAPSRYVASFAHRNEMASAGAYEVRLASGIDAALSATTRTGLARFTFPASARSGQLLLAPADAANARFATVHVLGSNRLAGSATSGDLGGACGTPAATYTIYFAVRFDRPFRSFGTWTRDTLTGGSRTSSGARAGAFVVFDTARERTVRAQIGISFVSARNAFLNLEREASSWSFDKVRARAQARWRRVLGAIRISGATAAEERVFYTALYHAFLHPNVFSDVNGEYLGRDGRVHRARGYTRYTNFSGWDVYRCEIPLLALLAPAQTSDMVSSLVADGLEGGRLSKWLLASTETGMMTGDPADPIIAGAYAFGARRFDAALALREMVLGATQPQPGPFRYPSRGRDGFVERPGLDQYLARGYLPLDAGEGDIAGPAATTLEYAVADFAIAQFALALHDDGDYATFLSRSANWKHLFNPASGFIEPRLASSSFLPVFNPAAMRGFVEGNSWQYSWMVPFDVGALVGAMGPAASVLARLDAFFAKLNAGPRAPHAWLGNEPSFGAPWTYLWLAAPWRTQAVARRAISTLFAPRPDGLPGNDDLGATSSWYVWAALGLYPAIPGVAGFAIGSPLFPRAVVSLGTGQRLEIVAPDASPATPYVTGLRLNGKPYDSTWLPLAQLTAGARLDFGLSTEPASWGSTPGAAPPSFDATPPPAS